MAKVENDAGSHMDSPPTRVTDEYLLFARRNPTKLAAWVLRSMIDELIDRRLTEKTWGDAVPPWRP